MSLEAFRDVDVSDHRVTAGAAATTGDVAKNLAGKTLFLPLDDNRTQSVVSAVLSMGASPFLRSGTGFGPLRNAVVEAEAVPTEGVGAGRAKTLRNKTLRDVLDGRRPAVITKLVLDADPAKTDESDRWTRAWTAVYERKTFAALCDALFGAGARNVPERVDLSVRVTSAAYSMKLVIIRTTGHGDAKAIEAIIQAAFETAKLAVLESRAVDGPGSSVATWVATGPGEAAPGEIPARFGSNAAPRPYAKFRSAFLDGGRLRHRRQLPHRPCAGCSRSGLGGAPVRAGRRRGRPRGDSRRGGRREGRERSAGSHGCGDPRGQGLTYGRGRAPSARSARLDPGRPARRRRLAEPHADAWLRPGVEQPRRRQQDPWFQG